MTLEDHRNYGNNGLNTTLGNYYFYIWRWGLNENYTLSVHYKSKMNPVHIEKFMGIDTFIQLQFYLLIEYGVPLDMHWISNHPYK